MTTVEAKPATGRARLRLIIRGAVQGVGFRPFVYRLATELELCGWVNNSPQGVSIEVEGQPAVLKRFLLGLQNERPPLAFIQSCEAVWLDIVGYDGFVIRSSETGGARTALVLPDVATCGDCLREILDPANRRYRYPFTNCTHCGPRFSIIESLPYDRANTSMRGFKMCPACRAEYHDPSNRRFHAQPNACPTCGPHLELWEPRAIVSSAQSRPIASDHVAMVVAAAAVRRGQIVAVKGIGGFHLVVDGRNEDAVRRLRERKQREGKPFGLMLPTLASARVICEVSPLEERLLRSPEAPIVLLKRIAGRKSEIADSVAPCNPNLGVMLPSNPLHHLLMAVLDFPVVATSGNLSDEPICTDEHEALERLGGIADVFLVHDRPIVRHMDDSIVRVALDREMVLRRARGYAPLPITLNSQPSTHNPQPVLAVGGHSKNSIALSVGDQVFLSQHIGDLETQQANDAFRRATGDLQKLFATRPAVIAADLHPDYLSTKFASASRAPQLVQVQHHVAHVLSCMAENEIEPPVLGVTWDGTGYGLDGTIWGGEFFLVTDECVKRVARLRPFRLPGGDAAAKEPRRAALGLLFQHFSDTTFQRKDLATLAAFSDHELAALQTMLARGLNAPWCSSVGRLFDAVASLIGVRQRMGFEGQAAMELEFALNGITSNEHYNLSLRTSFSPLLLDWSPMIDAILADVGHEVSPGKISAKFHNALVEAIVAVAKNVGEERITLSGGCFQNRYLTEQTVSRLRAENFHPYWHQRVPPNDGGIALGQIVAARRHLKQKGKTCAWQFQEKLNASLATTR